MQHFLNYKHLTDLLEPHLQKKKRKGKKENYKMRRDSI